MMEAAALIDNNDTDSRANPASVFTHRSVYPTHSGTGKFAHPWREEAEGAKRPVSNNARCLRAAAAQQESNSKIDGTASAIHPPTFASAEP